MNLNAEISKLYCRIRTTSYDSSAVERIEELVEEGNRIAQSFQMLMHYYGFGYKEDLEKGRALAETIVPLITDMCDVGSFRNEETYPETIYLYAVCLYLGLGVEKDLPLHNKLLQKIADSPYEYTLAMNALGQSYENGDGVEVNYEEATKWYRKAIERKFSTAIMNLARFYQYGIGVEKDEIEAVRYYQQAADLGDPSGYFRLGYCYANGYGVMENYSEAARCFEIAAFKGHPPSEHCLGWCYANGQGKPADRQEAFKWYLKSAENGYDEAQMEVAAWYEAGEDIEQDLEEYLRWLQKAADQEHFEAMYRLANRCLNSEDTESDNAKLIALLEKLVKEKADNQYYRPSCAMLGGCYLCQYGVEYNEEVALDWYTKGLCYHTADEEVLEYHQSVVELVFTLACKHNRRDLIVSLMEHQKINIYRLEDGNANINLLTAAMECGFDVDTWLFQNITPALPLAIEHDMNIICCVDIASRMVSGVSGKEEELKLVTAFHEFFVAGVDPIHLDSSLIPYECTFDRISVDGELIFYTARGRDVFVALLEMGLLLVENDYAASLGNWLRILLECPNKFDRIVDSRERKSREQWMMAEDLW